MDPKKLRVFFQGRELLPVKAENIIITKIEEIHSEYECLECADIGCNVCGRVVSRDEE